MADKTITIKSATDKELDELLIRLRKESEVQNIIANIKRQSSSGYTQYDQGQEISTEKPIDSLYHIGILGMKWGRRKSNDPSSIIKKQSHSDDHEKTKELKSKRTKELSNDEIKSLTERLRLEKNLRDIKSHDQTKGLEFIRTLTTVGTTVAALYALSSTPLGEAVKKSINKRLG